MSRVVWPGEAVPARPGLGRRAARTSRSSRRTRSASSSASSTSDGGEERIELRERTAFNWHCYLPGVGPGQRYGYRVHGAVRAGDGQALQPGEAPDRPVREGDRRRRSTGARPTCCRTCRAAGEDADLTIDETDSAPAIPKSVVIDPAFDWEDDDWVRPRIPWHETVIYEVHVKGFTKLRADVREDLRGTYARPRERAGAIEYLKSLGVTAVELLPVHHIADESFLHDRGLTNYWGYSTIGYLAPHSLYAATARPGARVQGHGQGAAPRRDRGDPRRRLQPHRRRATTSARCSASRASTTRATTGSCRTTRAYYMDYTGTGNTLNPVHPSVLRLIMDSLRYFVTECHVDGFRFDLASALAREFYEVDRLSAFFDIIHQDPVLSQVKLIAEPWDVGPGGYQVGNFPMLWSEWNGIYRDTMRDFWRGQATLADFASRFGGSADLYQTDGRRPFASINFITAHDGFTLRDLVSYNEKHNEANGEDNRDGTDDNRSWNCGVEGPTDDPRVNALRARQQRNFLATLLLSQGVPMLLGGDEIGRTQGGNNNAWCQDNEISWFDWELGRRRAARVHAAADRAAPRRIPVFRRTRFFEGRGEQLPDVWWMRPDGRRMTQTRLGQRPSRARSASS